VVQLNYETHTDIQAMGQIHSNPTLREPQILSTTPYQQNLKKIFNPINNICFPGLDCKLFNADSINIHNLYTMVRTNLYGCKGTSLCMHAVNMHTKILHKIHTKVQLPSIENTPNHNTVSFVSLFSYKLC
jgi:hypothetical protein